MDDLQIAAAQEAYQKAAMADVNVVNDTERAELMALASDFPRLWRDPRTQMKDKKRMLRLLIEDVTLTKGDTVHMDIRFVGGASHSLDLPLPKSCVVLRTTDAVVVQEIDRLVDTYTDKEIADLLNERGVRSVVTTPPQRRAAASTWCEWKGAATYWDVLGLPAVAWSDEPGSGGNGLLWLLAAYVSVKFLLFFLRNF